MYTSNKGLFSSDSNFLRAVEPLLLQNKVDLVLFGHVHNYERTCSVYNKQCKAMPTKDGSGVDTYDHRNYSAPVHAVIGMGGFTLDPSPNNNGRVLSPVVYFFLSVRLKIGAVWLFKSTCNKDTDKARVCKLRYRSC
ncbi:hypothetical protein L6164_017898 [Bauhinia variegata]|uniref:Uncharacterized protein n=1 Tax=Bauhinia variegata TaxID=167791 RepID=A0ACB9N9C5_BAUVA|nr:hypothetical protein L6164_017898 [Bauhinia variegata]